MDQRVAFIADWLRDEWTMTELAERYQISRKTAYKWVDRYEADPGGGAGRALARAEGARPGDGRRDPRRGPGAAARASALGAEEAAGRSCGAAAAPGVAGGEHDGRSVAPRGPESAAPAGRALSCR